MNKFDLKVIGMLMVNARASWADLASEIGLSAPAAADRVHRLIEKGVIKGFSAVIDPERAGCDCLAFVAVTLDRPQHRDGFIRRVRELNEIQECHHVAGDHDYLLKVRCRNTKDLDRVISEELKGLPGVVRTNTTIVMDSLKETHLFPLQEHVFKDRQEEKP